MVAFTGSTATGRRILKAAAPTLKRVFLELGGKSVNLVLDDADLEATLAGSAVCCMHGGQGCAIPTRLLVPRSHYDEAVEMARTAFENWAYGDPTDLSVLQGPQISRRQQERVLDYIHVDNAMSIAQEEIFGPVLVVIGFDDDDDAVRIANESPYGLSGMITSADLDRAKAVARRIRTGTLGINGGIWYGADAPFGGYKGSGLGRQCGIEGLEIFTETKTVGWPAEN